MNHNHSKIQSGFVRWKCRTIYYSARGTTDGIVPTRIAVRIFSWRIIDKIFLFSWNLFWNSPTYRQLYSKIKKLESRDLDYRGNEIEKHELGNFFEKPHLNKQIKIQVHLEWCTHFKSWEIHCKQESALRITKSVWFESSINRNGSFQSFFTKRWNHKVFENSSWHWLIAVSNDQSEIEMHDGQLWVDWGTYAKNWLRCARAQKYRINKMKLTLNYIEHRKWIISNVHTSYIIYRMDHMLLTI